MADSGKIFAGYGTQPGMYPQQMQQFAGMHPQQVQQMQMQQYYMQQMQAQQMQMQMQV